MNIISTLLLFIVIASCSKPNSNPVSRAVSDLDENVVRFEEIQISLPLTGIPTAPVSLDFASLAYKQSGVQDLVLYNSASSGTITYQASDFDSSLVAPFAITSNGCLSPLAARKKCIISFSIANSSSLPDPQTISSLFKVKGVDINLSAILEKDNTDYAAPVANISVSPLVLNFGTFKVGESKELSLVVKNNALSGSIPISVGTSINPNLVISSNLCPASLLNRRSCSIKIKYTGVASETFSNADLINIANNQITYSGTVTSPSVQEPEVLSIEPTVQSTSVAINQPDVQTGSIIFNNLGTLPIVAPVNGVSSDDGLVVNSITCLGGLNRSKSCTVNYTINSPALPAGVSVQTIRLQSGAVASKSFVLNLDVTPSSVPCTLADLSANGVSFLNSNSSFVGTKTGSDISQCLLAATACNQYYSIATDSKSCQAVSSACLPADAQANGWDITQALTVSGSRSGSDIASCAVSDCNAEYLLNVGGKTCDGVACSLANAQGNGLSSILNVATVSGNINDDSCLVSACDQYYKNASDNRSCSPKLCTELNAGELSSLGFNLTGATISGTYNSCTVSCTSPFQQLAVDGKSCEDKMPTGTISFAQDYTKILTPNVVNITSSNAQSIQFYSDAGCVTPAGTAIALLLSSTNLTLSPGDGTKTAYAKLINGSASSTCSSDVIILDQTSPSAISLKFVDKDDASLKSESEDSFAFTYSSQTSPKMEVVASETPASCIAAVGLSSSSFDLNMETLTSCQNIQISSLSLVSGVPYFLNIKLLDSLGNESSIYSKPFKYRPHLHDENSFKILNSVNSKFKKQIYKSAELWVFQGIDNKIYSNLRNGSIVESAVTITEVETASEYNADSSYPAFFVGDYDKIYKIDKTTGSVTQLLNENTYLTTFGNIHPKIIPTYSSLFYFSRSVDTSDYRLRQANPSTGAFTTVIAPASGGGTGHNQLVNSSMILAPQNGISSTYVAVTDTLVFTCKSGAGTTKVCVIKPAASLGTKTGNILSSQTATSLNEDPALYTALNSVVYYKGKLTGGAYQIYKIPTSSTIAGMSTRTKALTNLYSTSNNMNVSDFKTFSSKLYIALDSSLFEIDGANDNLQSGSVDSLLVAQPNLRIIKNPYPFSSTYASNDDSLLAYEINVNGSIETVLLKNFPVLEKKRIITPDNFGISNKLLDGFVLSAQDDSAYIEKYRFLISMVENNYGQVQLIKQDLLLNTSSYIDSFVPSGSSLMPTAPMVYFNDKIYTALNLSTGTKNVGYASLNNLGELLVSELYYKSGTMYFEFLNPTSRGINLGNYSYDTGTGSFVPFDDIYISANSIMVVHNAVTGSSNKTVLENRKTAFQPDAYSKGYFVSEKYTPIVTSNATMFIKIKNNTTNEELVLLNTNFDFEFSYSVNSFIGKRALEYDSGMFLGVFPVNNMPDAGVTFIRFLKNIFIQEAFAQGPPPPLTPDSLMLLPFDPTL